MKTEAKFITGIAVITLILITFGAFLLGRNKNQIGSSPQTIDQNILLSNARYTKGNHNAPVNIVEFADFQCPACSAAQPIVKKVIEQNADKVYFVFRHYPLTFHQNAKIAAQAAEAAGKQEKFWEMHDLIYQKQKEWGESLKAEEIFQGYARELGLDLEQFKSDFGKVTDPIERDYADGNKIGVDSTPTFFINGKKYPGVIPEEQLTRIISDVK